MSKIEKKLNNAIAAVEAKKVADAAAAAQTAAPIVLPFLQTLVKEPGKGGPNNDGVFPALPPGYHLGPAIVPVAVIAPKKNLVDRFFDGVNSLLTPIKAVPVVHSMGYVPFTPDNKTISLPKKSIAY